MHMEIRLINQESLIIKTNSHTVWYENWLVHVAENLIHFRLTKKISLELR